MAEVENDPSVTATVLFLRAVAFVFDGIDGTFAESFAQLPVKVDVQAPSSELLVRSLESHVRLLAAGHPADVEAYLRYMVLAVRQTISELQLEGS